MSDAPELRTQVRHWFVETGWTDGNGIGLWDRTDESVAVASRIAAEALRDEWLSQGKIEVDRWGGFKRTGPYGAFRIRSLWEDATPAALAASPEVQALTSRLTTALSRLLARCDRTRATGGIGQWEEMTEAGEALAEAAAIRGEGK